MTLLLVQLDLMSPQVCDTGEFHSGGTAPHNDDRLLLLRLGNLVQLLFKPYHGILDARHFELLEDSARTTLQAPHALPHFTFPSFPWEISSNSCSNPTTGFWTHDISNCWKILLVQPCKHPMHFLISSSLPSLALLTKSGSAIFPLHIPTKSACPSASTFSANCGSFIR